jgi:transposase
VGFATCELVAAAPRVNCPEHGPTVAHVSWARHDNWFSRAFEDVVVFDAICSNKLAPARRRGVLWRAVNAMWVRVATEALGRVDLASSLVTVAIDEVKYKERQKYLTVICDHLTAKVIWAAKGRTKDTANSFFDALGEERSAKLQFVTCDTAEWIRTVVAERAPGALVCLDTFHLMT